LAIALKMRAQKAAKDAVKKPDKEAQQEQKLILKDVRDNMFRAAVLPAAYSVEEFLLGACTFPEHRLKVIKLAEDEVGGGPSILLTNPPTHPPTTPTTPTPPPRTTTTPQLRLHFTSPPAQLWSPRS
jgi:hypothetical protein